MFINEQNARTLFELLFQSTQLVCYQSIVNNQLPEFYILSYLNQGGFTCFCYSFITLSDEIALLIIDILLNKLFNYFDDF